MIKQRKLALENKKNYRISKIFASTSYEQPKVFQIPIQFKFLFFSKLNSYLFYPFKGKTAVDYVTNLESSGNDSPKLPLDLTEEDFQPPPKKKMSAEMWKEKYFASIVNVEEKSSDAEIKKAHLKAYHTLLQCIQMEEKMGLKDYEISYLRSTVSATLSEYPSYLSTYCVEDMEFP